MSYWAFTLVGFVLGFYFSELLQRRSWERYARSRFAIAENALKEISKETIYTYDDGNEGPYIKLRAKFIAGDALRELEP